MKGEEFVRAVALPVGTANTNNIAPQLVNSGADQIQQVS